MEKERVALVVTVAVATNGSLREKLQRGFARGEGMISEAELAEIEVRAEKANPGPWSFGASYEVWRMEPWGARRIAEVSKVPNDTEDAQGRYDTVDFIAHARQDVPALVGSLRESQSEVRRLRTALAALVEEQGGNVSLETVRAVLQIGEGTD